MVPYLWAEVVLKTGNNILKCTATVDVRSSDVSIETKETLNKTDHGELQVTQVERHGTA